MRCGGRDELVCLSLQAAGALVPDYLILAGKSIIRFKRVSGR